MVIFGKCSLPHPWLEVTQGVWVKGQVPAMIHQQELGTQAKCLALLLK